MIRISATLFVGNYIHCLFFFILDCLNKFHFICRELYFSCFLISATLFVWNYINEQVVAGISGFASD
jgi:hypothetical protein